MLFAPSRSLERKQSAHTNDNCVKFDALTNDNSERSSARHGDTCQLLKARLKQNTAELEKLQNLFLSQAPSSVIDGKQQVESLKSEALAYKELAEKHKNELQNSQQQIQATKERISEYERIIIALQQKLEEEETKAATALSNEKEVRAWHDDLWEQNQSLQKTIIEMQEKHAIEVHQNNQLDVHLQESKEEIKTISKHALEQDQRIETLTKKISEMEQHISLLKATIEEKDEIFNENKESWDMLASQWEEKMQQVLEENEMLKQRIASSSWEDRNIEETIDELAAAQKPLKQEDHPSLIASLSQENVGSFHLPTEVEKEDQPLQMTSDYQSKVASWINECEQGLINEVENDQIDPYPSVPNRSAEDNHSALRESSLKVREFEEKRREEEEILAQTRKMIEEEQLEYSKTLAQKEQAAKELQELKRKLTSRIPQMSSRHSSISHIPRNRSSISYTYQSQLTSKLEEKLEMYRKNLETTTNQCHEQQKIVDRLNLHLGFLHQRLSEYQSLLQTREEKYIELVKESQELKEENKRLKVNIDRLSLPSKSTKSSKYSLNGEKVWD
ncbi:hypothetical protein EC973_002558 [Apophysomyces ossiformis]|uniref:Uncharacterized protein n=1 Tax=Apophysomyces ossiformis TaxID=679940 RepID=A0A8H7BTX7_9FUNG|nr:hypothetical protein EC973_002558 [Apophysomyces ossiformis]